MKRYFAIKSWVPMLLAIYLLAGPTIANENDVTVLVKEILDTSGVQGSIVVHLGCGDGKLTVALRINDYYTVHGLEADPAKVAEARRYIRSKSIYGPPRSLQWVAPPLWLRSHETPSGIQSPVSAAGQLFYFSDEGLIDITNERLPDRWSLVCRDAFNGRLL